MNKAFLFCVEDKPNEENLETISINCLAEWSDHLPALFLLLIGENAIEGNNPPVLMTPYTDASRRLRGLITLAESLSDQPKKSRLLDALRQSEAVMAEQDGPYLLLHLAEVAFPMFRYKFNSKAFRRFLESIRAASSRLDRELAAALGAGELDAASAPALHALISKPEKEIGYWSKDLVDTFWQDFTDEPDELPAFLDKYRGYWYSSEDSAVQYDTSLGAYLVRQCRKKQRTRHGIVTPYGRWIVPMMEAYLSVSSFPEKDRCSWITVTIETSPEWTPYEKRESLTGLLDANGCEVLPVAYPDIFVVSDKLAFVTRRKTKKADEPLTMLRLDTMAWLPGEFRDIGSGRKDGYISAEVAGSDGNPRTGVIDREGNTLVPFMFDTVSEFNKRTKLAMAVIGAKVGLINQNGEIVLPVEYDGISTKDGEVPHFFGDRALIFLKAGTPGHPDAKRVGIADKTGKIIVPPKMICWHLHYTFDKDGKVWVCEGDTLFELSADGSLSGPIGSVQATIDAIGDYMRKSWRQDNSVLPDEGTHLAEKLDRVAFAELLSILCRRNTAIIDPVQEAANKLIDRIAAGDDMADEEDEEDEASEFTPRSGDSPAAPFFRALRLVLRDEQALMHIDWKDASEIAEAGLHMPDIAALSGFSWTGAEEGEDVAAGLDALAEFLGQHGYRLIDYQTESDSYMFGAIRQSDLERFLSLTASLQVGVGLHE